MCRGVTAAAATTTSALLPEAGNKRVSQPSSPSPLVTTSAAPRMASRSDGRGS